MMSAVSVSHGQHRVDHVDHHVPSRPENLAWGAFPKDKPPILHVKSGQTVRIDTLSHAGATQDEHPVEYLAKYGVKPDEVLKDVNTSGPRERSCVRTAPVAVTSSPARSTSRTRRPGTCSKCRFCR
jgi:hypothetical protein